LGVAVNNIRWSRAADALPLLEEALQILELTPNVASSIETNGQIALAYLRLGQEEKALAHAERALSLSENISPTVYSMDIGFSGVADVYFELWEKAIQTKRPDVDFLRQCAVKAIKLLRAFEKVFPIGQPVTPVYQGWYEWLTDNPDAAIKTLTKGLQAAQKFKMRYEEGMIRLKLAVYAQGNLEARKKNLGRAIELFEQMGAVNELRLAREEARRAGF
jgi:tetratricopeptide (TPR) repeat protein